MTKEYTTSNIAIRLKYTIDDKKYDLRVYSVFVAATGILIKLNINNLRIHIIIFRIKPLDLNDINQDKNNIEKHNLLNKINIHRIKDVPILINGAKILFVNLYK